jgi:hypothetical protein
MTEEKNYKVTHSFYIAGVQHHQMYKVLKDMKIGERLSIIPDPENKYDPNAIRLEYLGIIMVGFVPKKFSSEVNAKLAVGKTLECVIVELNPTKKPWEQCKVEIMEVANA